MRPPAAGRRRRETPHDRIAHTPLISPGFPPDGGDFAARLDAIDWHQYETAYGPATDVPMQLRKLVGGNEREALDATSALDGMLCHQHVRVDSAASPALPFLLEAMECASPKVCAEIMGTIRGMAACMRRASEERPEAYAADRWVRELHHELLAEKPRWDTLKQQADGEIAEYADRTLEALFSPDRPELGLD